MLRQEDDDLITHVGPGTPMGNFMRQYWVPAILSKELRATLAASLAAYGVTDLDAATIRLATARRLTQEISRSAYEATAPLGSHFAGIRYASRLGDEFENWAIFESTPAAFQIIQVRPIDPLDPELLEALSLLEIELY